MNPIILLAEKCHIYKEQYNTHQQRISQSFACQKNRAIHSQRKNKANKALPFQPYIFTTIQMSVRITIFQKEMYRKTGQTESRWRIQTVQFYFFFVIIGPQCTENSIYVFPEMKMRGRFPISYIHVSVSDIYSQDRSAYLAAAKQADRSCATAFPFLTFMYL